MKLPQLKTLVKTSVYVCIAGLTSVLYMRSKIKDRVRNEDYYRNALKILRAHPGAIEFLGEPIKEYGFDLTDPKHNFCDGQKAGFEVIVNGSKDKGTMHFWAERVDGNWQINRIELALDKQQDKRLLVK